MDIKKKHAFCRWMGAIVLPCLMIVTLVRFAFKVQLPVLTALFFLLLLIYAVSLGLKKRYERKIQEGIAENL